MPDRPGGVPIVWRGVRYRNAKPVARIPRPMRFVLYNIRYATGTGAAFHLPVPGRAISAAIPAS